LNSLQLRYLLDNYQPARDEQPIPRQLIDKVVDIARSTADDMTISEGRDIRLDEERDLQLPFLLPEDGYSCDNIKGLPPGLADFLHAAVDRGLY
jgi:afadin